MNVIIAGSRTATKEEVHKALNSCPWVYLAKTVISGTARGADRFGEQWAEANGIPILRFPADWKTYGKKAGHLRNEAMAKQAQGLIAIWDGKSKGTRHMIKTAMHYKLCVFIYYTDWNYFYSY